MSKLKDFEIMCIDFSEESAADVINELEKENEELKEEIRFIKRHNELLLKKMQSFAREINNLEEENQELKSEKEALKKFIQKIISYASNVYAEDVCFKEKTLNKN